MEKISILIADDHALIRDAWKVLLNSDDRFEVVAESCDGNETLSMARVHRPQIILMDINMPSLNGIDSIPFIRKYVPGTRIIGVSTHTQPAYATKMMQKGAMGYVTKTSPLEELLNAISEVQSGRKYICEEIRSFLSSQALDSRSENDGINSLTHREIEIIDLIKTGASSKEIANQFSLSIKTVEAHRYNILRKLKLKNSSALVDYINAHQSGVS